MIDSVYTVVQQMLNKNGYGLLTPARFISFAESAQLECIEDVLNESRVNKRKVSQYDTTDTLDLYDAIIEIFSETTPISRNNGAGLALKHHVLPDDYMRWGRAFYDDVEITKTTSSQQNSLKHGYFIKATSTHPFCYIEGNKLYILPDTIGKIDDGSTEYAFDEVSLVYYRYPKKPNWTYETISGNFVFDPDSDLYQDFEVPRSMFNDLVTKILRMSGIHIRSEEVVAYSENDFKMNYQKDNR